MSSLIWVLFEEEVSKIFRDNRGWGQQRRNKSKHFKNI